MCIQCVKTPSLAPVIGEPCCASPRTHVCSEVQKHVRNPQHEDSSCSGRQEPDQGDRLAVTFCHTVSLILTFARSGEHQPSPPCIQTHTRASCTLPAKSLSCSSRNVKRTSPSYPALLLPFLKDVTEVCVKRAWKSDRKCAHLCMEACQNSASSLPHALWPLFHY